jgi:hypothetical protein
MAVRGSFRLGRVPARENERHVDGGEIEACCAKRETG